MKMVSIVIPAYNEEKALPNTLRALFQHSGDYEVIIADGGSTDRTRTVLHDFGFSKHPLPLTARLSSPKSPHPSRLFLTAPKGRASQMNVGAAAALGEWLLFLHADTVLPAGAIQRLNDMEIDATVQAGGFMHRFSGHDWRLRLISFLDNFRCTRSRIIYGDQALFVRRELFHGLGGFPDVPILEDVAFCERLIRVTEPRLLTPPVITDSRKFVQMGIWRSFARVLAIILHVEWGLPILPRVFFQDIR
ncbi:MAG: TIGR04283 family arsenosugar biosynthesis glycosyltransferase [Nitrospiraceae bacterium]